MANNDGLHRNKNVLIKILISFVIAISPIILINNANAANLGGWSMSNPVAQGASVLYQGAKNVIINGANVAKTSTALITPAASNVAKVLARGAAGYALSVAVEQLLGAVDWVLDPANNRIKYYEPNTADPPHLFQSFVNDKVVSARTACTGFGKIQQPDPWKSFTFKITGDLKKGYYCDFSITYSWGDKENQKILLTPVVIKPEAEREEKYLPLTTVAQKVISNASSGDTNAQVATTAAAADMVKDAESDNVKARPIINQLDANAKVETKADANTATGEQTQNPTKPEVKDLKLEFPAFCGWAPIVCEAAQKVISFPNTLIEWWGIATTSLSDAYAYAKTQVQAATDYFKDDIVQKDETTNDFQVPNFDADKVHLTGSNQCPSDSVSFNVMGRSVTLNMPYQPICDALSFFKPAVLLVGAIASVFIIAGINRKGNEE